MSELSQDERLEEAFRQTETGEDPVRGGGAGRAIGVIATLVALIAAGLGGYAAFVSWQLKQSQPELEQRLSGVDVRISGVDARLGQLAARPDPAAKMSTLERELASQLQRSDEAAASRLAEALSRFEDQVGTTSQDWLLAEAEFLVRMAHHRLEMQQDAEGAAVLLRAADDVVRHAELPRGFAIRQAIANDVALLELTPSVDTTGYFLRIAALDGQIARLREKTPSFEPDTHAAPAAGQAEEAGVTATLLGYASRAGEYIGDQFEFRRGHEPIRPLMPQRERYYLEQNLRLQLQTARLALLRQDQVVYATSLIQAADWVVTWFDPDDAVTRQLEASLRTLADATVSGEVPRIGDSLAAIRSAMVDFDERSARGAPARNPAAAEVLEAAPKAAPEVVPEVAPEVAPDGRPEVVPDVLPAETPPGTEAEI